MFKRTQICTGVLLAIGSATWVAPAWAQSQTVEVTGSRIKRTDAETAAPVQTVTREEIDRSGRTSVAELLQTLAVDNQGSVPTTFGAGFASGASGISLRGLGAASTLVLVNGRRIAPYGLADDGQKVFADVNMIPLDAVERVEILKDGASSIYGSDAIAGVVNIILRKDYTGGGLRASYGQSRYSDGKEARASITGGFGNLDSDKYNVLMNLEVLKKNPIWNSQRQGRTNYIGRADLRDLGFSAQEALGGQGAITTNNAAGSSVNGNVRNPSTLDYYSRGETDSARSGFVQTFPGAACSNFTNHRQGDPGYNANVDADGNTILPFIQSGQGCLTDAQAEYVQIQPSQKSVNLFTRGSVQFSTATTGYVELNYYKNKSRSEGTPSGISGSVGYPGGPVSNAGVSLGASHPDNPYLGTAARLRYLAADVGPRISNVESEFTRGLVGVTTTLGSWDLDSAVLYSQNKVRNERSGFLQRDVTFALLNPTAANVATATANSAAYAALPPGTVWRIAENAGLNSAAMYAALSPKIANDAVSKTAQFDIKGSTSLGRLSGGPIGLAVGAEYRQESIRLDPTQGTDRGNIIGLGYSAYDGKRNVTAAFAEVLAPFTKQIEGSVALRADHYSDVGDAFTPKVGVKFTPIEQLAVRATYAQGFRAPSSAENGKGGLAAFSTADDPLRCALGVTAACNPATVAIITSPNPNLKPEKSTSYTLGLVFEPIQGTSASLDLWQIIRKNEINQEQTTAAIAAGQVSRDPTTATTIPGDPGAITAVLANYVNSTKTKVQGIDIDLQQTVRMGEMGKLTFDLKWTHLFKLQRTETDGTTSDFAGTHGNCDVTNCIGTPANRANFGATWDVGVVAVSTVVNYRGAMSNKLRKEDTDCASHFADGTDAPGGCKIKSFTTVDLSLRYRPIKNLEVFGSVLNLLDAKAPLDPLTYGATSYNPLDYMGAVGRYYSVGARYKF